VPTYKVNDDAVVHAKRLIEARQYVLRSRWQAAQPHAREQNAFLKTHSWEEYAAWHLALTDGAAEETKARYAFVYGDLRRLHRMGRRRDLGVVAAKSENDPERLLRPRIRPSRVLGVRLRRVCLV
jgi:hypothetical protein